MTTNGNQNERATEMSRKDKEKVLEAAVQNIEKQFGKGSVMRLGNGEALADGIENPPEGSTSPDEHLGLSLAAARLLQSGVVVEVVSVE